VPLIYRHVILWITGQAIQMQLQDLTDGYGIFLWKAECMAWLRQHRPSFTPSRRRTIGPICSAPVSEIHDAGWTDRVFGGELGFAA
jgi:hypothetical protein